MAIRATSEHSERWRIATFRVKPGRTALVFAVLGVAGIGYAFLAGWRSLTEFDLGWQMATGRWIIQHHQIPSTDVFSYTAAGRPWIYPIGASLIFYAAYVLGNYALLSWLQAMACAGTVALALRTGSPTSGVLAILAVPLIAIRTRPRADMFTVILFAAFLSLLWEHHQTGRARLWLLPILMLAWVNLHLGFVAGLALMAGYVLVETLEIVWPECREAAAQRLRAAWPWLIAAVCATLVNPWGYRIFDALLGQESAMSTQLQWIPEWGPATLNWTAMSTGLSLRNPAGAFYLMLMIAAAVIPVALWRRQFGAAALIGGAAVLAVRHIRFEALFACVVVVVAGSVLSCAFRALSNKIKQAMVGPVRGSGGITIAVVCLCVALACVRSADLVTDRSYLASTDLGSFGTGLSWWFPERAAAFIERENIPGRIFNSYNEGGYFAWRLGSKYRDYVDGRAIPFGPRLVERNRELMATPPDSPEWLHEAEQYGINAMLIPLGRYSGLRLFPVLPQFCASKAWRPVYLDEVSAVFVRVTAENEDLIARLQIQCAVAPLPAVASRGNGTDAFNQWANAAAVLQALGRGAEAFASAGRALAIFPDTAFVHFLRANLLAETGNLGAAEQDYLLSAALEQNGTTWSRLATIYHRQGRFINEITAWERASDLLPYPAPELLALGYADVVARRPQDALHAFDRAVANLPPRPQTTGDDAFFADVAHGRAMAWYALGDLPRAVSFAEATVKLRPERAHDWLDLANLYDRAQRFEDGRRARERAAAVNREESRPSGSRQEP
jgi:tetratricopeptide (TPR) repeat protein